VALAKAGMSAIWNSIRKAKAPRACVRYLITADETLREKLRLSKQEKISAEPGAGVAAETEIFGGISQFYRRENQYLEDQGTDPVQSALQNDLDLNVRHRGEMADLQARFSGGYLYDFLENGPDPETRVSTLFVTPGMQHDYRVALAGSLPRPAVCWEFRWRSGWCAHQ
jgi:hypothetical protein